MENLIFVTDKKRHLICLPYSVENLHRMATILKINKCWFHAGTKPHYDIPKKRIKEIEMLCEIVTSKELVRIIKDV